MSDRSGIFAGDDPFAIARSWLAEAEPGEMNDANAMALATVDANGMPNARMVLLKEIEADAFVFYTNYQSAKGRELEANPVAAFVIHWKSLRRQIRARGVIEKEKPDLVVPEIEAIATTEYPTRAPRPANSRLDSTSIVDAAGIRLPGWRTSLPAVIEQIQALTD